jgi:hypothetical protein
MTEPVITTCSRPDLNTRVLQKPLNLGKAATPSLALTRLQRAVNRYGWFISAAATRRKREPQDNQHSRNESHTVLGLNVKVTGAQHDGA